MSWTCFWLTPVDRCQVELRRYAGGTSCPGGGRLSYHDARIAIGVEPHPLKDGLVCDHGPDIPRDDPRWPRACACGYVFADSDPWQTNRHQIYARGDGGPETTLPDVPPGAMWDATWWPGKLGRGGDGIALVIRLPGGGDWMPDMPASNGPKGEPGWTRAGTVPRITARPSIGHPNYHGWLTDGVLSDDLEGRTYRDHR